MRDRHEKRGAAEVASPRLDVRDDVGDDQDRQNEKQVRVAADVLDHPNLSLNATAPASLANMSLAKLDRKSGWTPSNIKSMFASRSHRSGVRLASFRTQPWLWVNLV